MPIVTVSCRMDAREALGDGASPVVVIPVYNGYEDAIQCLHAVLRHTPVETDILIIDDGSVDPRVASLPSQVRGAVQRVVMLLRGENWGFTRTVNEAFEVAGRRDVVLLNSDVIVGREWLGRLREAAYSDSRIATATALTNNGTILSVPYRNTPTDLPLGFTPESAAGAVAAAAGKLRPRIPTSVGHCTYIKRIALDVVGVFDEAFSPGYGEEVDFSQRCILSGFSHVCADDVFVYHRGSASFGSCPEKEKLRRDHEQIIAARYPFYHAWVAATASANGSALASAITSARRALLGMTVVVDATSLGAFITGTQRVGLETMRALARHPRIKRVIAVLPPGHLPHFADAFEGHEKLELIHDGRPSSAPLADIAFRPVQVWSGEDLERLRALGERFVFMQLDLIAFNNPGYFPDWESWARFRDITRLAFAAADGVAFNSQHCEREAREEGLLAPGKPTTVAYNGTDHFRIEPSPIPPAGVPPDTAEKGYVLCLGTDFRHKNRLFALRVFAKMLEQGYSGLLVLAGLPVPLGSSRPAEAEYLVANPALARRIVTLAAVSEAERAWLYKHASLILHPSLYEGFGLVPFEAAAFGVPCLSSTQSSLGEVLPERLEVISDWDPETVARQAMSLLADPHARKILVEVLQRRGREFTWDGVAGRLVNLFESVCKATRDPVRAALPGEQGTVATAALILPPAANGLGDPFLDNVYPPDFKKALRAIGRREKLRKPVVATTVFAYRAYRMGSRLLSKIVSYPRGDSRPRRR